MSVEDLRWAIGIAVSAWLGMAGIIVGAFRSLSGKMDRNDRDVRISVKEGNDALHERVNRVRDEYVRRADLDDRLKHLQETQTEMRADIKAIRDTLASPRGRN